MVAKNASGSIMAAWHLNFTPSMKIFFQDGKPIQLTWLLLQMSVQCQLQAVRRQNISAYEEYRESRRAKMLYAVNADRSSRLHRRDS